MKLRLKPTSESRALHEHHGIDGEDVGTDASTGVPRRSTIIDLPAKEGLMTPNIAAIIRQHVSLEVRCIDRLYLHAWMPKLQTSGGLCYFLHEHLGHPIPSPALFKPLHDRFVPAIPAFAHRHRIPTVAFEPQAAEGRHRGRVSRGASPAGRASSSSAWRKRRCASFKAHKRPGPGTTGHLRLLAAVRSPSTTTTSTSTTATGARPSSRSGPTCRIPVKLCLNGHEWVKQHLRRQRVRFESLDNGFLRCSDPAALQATCDALGPGRRAGLLRSLVASAALADDAATTAPPAMTTGSRSASSK